jgi:hypothetical protein
MDARARIPHTVIVKGSSAKAAAVLGMGGIEKVSLN